jgi:hypothetical protein
MSGTVPAMTGAVLVIRTMLQETWTLETQGRAQEEGKIQR